MTWTSKDLSKLQKHGEVPSHTPNYILILLVLLKWKHLTKTINIITLTALFYSKYQEMNTQKTYKIEGLAFLYTGLLVIEFLC